MDTFLQNLPWPLFSKEGEFLPLAKGGQEGILRDLMSSSLLREDSNNPDRKLAVTRTVTMVYFLEKEDQDLKPAVI